DRGPADDVKSVAAGNEIARELARLATLAEGNARLVGVEVANRDAFDAEADVAARCEARGDEVLDHLVLGVHSDRAPAGEHRQIDTVALTAEAELDAVMEHAFALHPFADARFAEQIDGTLLQHPRANRALDVLARAVFEHDGVDPLKVQQVRK